MPVTQCACLDGWLPATYDHVVDFPFFFVFLVWISQCESLSSCAVWTAECVVQLESEALGVKECLPSDLGPNVATGIQSDS